MVRFQLWFDVWGRKTRIGYFWFTILIVVIIDPIVTDLLPYLTVGRPFSLEDFLYNRVCWIAILLIIIIGVNHFKRAFERAVDDLSFILGDNRDRIRTAFFDNKVKWTFTFAFIAIYIYGTISEVSYMMAHPDIVGTSTVAHRGASNGLVSLLLTRVVINMILYSPVLGEAVAVIIAIMRLDYEVGNRININNVRLLDSHRCAGLHPLGNLNSDLSAMIFVIITIYSMSSWVSYIRGPVIVYYWETLLFVAILWSFCLMVFLLPQILLHKQMAEIRQFALESTLEELNEMEERKPSYIHERIYIEQRKTNLFSYLNEIEKMREYPIEYKTVNTIITLAVLPLVVNLVGLLIQENVL